MADLFEDHVPIGEMVSELQRELVLRRRVFPRQVAEGRLRAGIADRRIRVLEAIVELLGKAGESG